jgi:hypothetical protein
MVGVGVRDDEVAEKERFARTLVKGEAELIDCLENNSGLGGMISL